MRINVGGVYKCNCGGVWLAKEQESPAYISCVLIGSWMDDVVYNRGSRMPIAFHIGGPYGRFNFDSDSGAVNDSLQFVSEIVP